MEASSASMASSFSAILRACLSRDPIGEKGGKNLYNLAGNNALNNLDLLGLFASDSFEIARGYSQIIGSLTRLEKECDCCVSLKDTDQCKTEAKSIVETIANLWIKNYGQGQDHDQDCIGGFYCWSWALAFNKYVSALKTKIWSADLKIYVLYESPTSSIPQKITHPDGTITTPTHVALGVQLTKVEKQNSEANCSGFAYDDGFGRDGNFHELDNWQPNGYRPYEFLNSDEEKAFWEGKTGLPNR